MTLCCLKWQTNLNKHDLYTCNAGFSKTHIHRLYIRYQQLDKEKKGYLVTEDLLEIPQVKFNPVSEKIIETFLPKGRFDLDGKPVKSGHITFSQFARTFSVFQPIRSRQSDDVEAPNSKENKIRFLFNMIDSSKTGQITHEEIFEILELMTCENVSQDQLVMMANRIAKEADKTGDGIICFEEFQEAVAGLDFEGKMAFRTFF